MARRAALTMVDGVAPGTQLTGARLVAILKDGSDGPVHSLGHDQSDIGRSEGDLTFSDDGFLSPRHARILRRGDTHVLIDLASVNGVYVRLVEPVPIQSGDMILLGQQVLRFETLDPAESMQTAALLGGVSVFGTPAVVRHARLVQYSTEGVARDVHYLHRDETVMGREFGDIVFTDDPFLSRRHASLCRDARTHAFVLKDLGSSNGTSIRLRGERLLRDRDQFRVGRHLFRFERGGPGAFGT